MAMNLKNYIGLEVRAARHRKRLTQEQLAERVDRAVETISNIERGNTWTGLETLEALSRVLDRPIQSFFPPDRRSLSRSPSVKKLELELMAIVALMSKRELEQLLKLTKVIKTD